MSQLSGNTRDNTTGNLTSLASFHSMTDHTEWMSELTKHGNKPCEWLAYLSLVESHTMHAEETSRYRFLSLAYNRATKQIPIDKYCEDPSYARIIIKLAHLKASQDVDDGRMIFKFARANVRKQAIVHLEAAKFEEIHGDTKKCLSILEKGLKVTSDPRLTEALQRVKNGLPILQESQEPMDSHEGPQTMASAAPASVHTSHNETDEKKSHVPCTMEYVDTTVSFRRPEVGSRKPTQSKCENSDHEGDTMPINAGSQYSGLQTPDVANKFSVFGSSRRKRSGNIGMPMRVSRTSLPQLKKECQDDDDDDDDDDNDNDIRPLKSSPQETHPGLLAPITEKTNESDSGVQTTPRDITQRDRDPFTIKARTMEMGAESTVPGPWASSVQRHDPAMSAQQMHHHQMPVQQQWQQQHQPTPQMSIPHGEPPQMQLLQQQLFQQPNPAAMQPSHHFPAPQMVAPVAQPKSKNTVQVNGKGYSIIRLIGKGGSSKVFQVLSEDSKKLLALKYVKLDFADEMAMQSYMNEITLLERLKSFKRIIHLYDYEITEDYIYLVMECGSIDLATFLKKNKDSLSPHHMWCYWQEMLEAVDVIHKQGIVHSDLKPANFIFVEASLKLIDFGIANAIQNDHTSVVKESQVGTLNYMSPEAIQDTSPVTEVNEYGHKKPRLKINCKSDVWSLGCILYSMVYGRTPFQHIVHRLLKMQAICNPDHVIDFPPIENELLLDVMKKCLTRDVRNRPSIQELLNHPYVKKPFTAAEKSTASLTTEHISALVSQLSQSQINSPRSIARLAQGVVEQISRGQQIDVSSAVKGSAQQQVPAYDPQQMSQAPQQYPYPHQPHQYPQPHAHHHHHHQGPVSGHEGGYRSQRAPLRVINSSDVMAPHQPLLKPLSLSSKYDISSSQENGQMNS